MATNAGQLIVYLEGKALRSLPLIESLVTIGRDASNTLVLELQPTSRKHAELSVEGAGVHLKDVGSSQGTFVNGQKLLPHQPRQLATGDAVQIGPYILVYQVIEQLAAGDDTPALQEHEAPPVLPPDLPLAAPVEQPQLAPVRAARQVYELTMPECGRQCRYLHSLPIIFHGNDFLNRYLLLFESLWEPFEQRQDHIEMYFDPRTCPETFLPWLASWFDIAMDRHWPEARRRQLLSNAVDLYRKRGTRDGLAHMIEVCTGLTPQITDLSAPQDDGQTQPFVFRVRLAIPAGSDVERDFIEALIRAHKPAHADYILEVTT